MADRLAELIRQRALIQEHLAWLNQQIADAAEAAKAKTFPPSAGASTLVPSPSPVATPVRDPAAMPATPRLVPISGLSGSASSLPAEAEEILAQYQKTPSSVKQDVRKGCLLYFVLAFVLLGAGVAALYFLLSANR